MVPENLQDFLELIPQKDDFFIRGDRNVRVGSPETPGITGKFGLGGRNEAAPFGSVAQLHLTLCDPMNCSTPGLTVLCPMSESLNRKREGLQDNATGKKGKFIIDSSQGPLPHPTQWCRSEGPKPKLLHKFIG